MNNNNQNHDEKFLTLRRIFNEEDPIGIYFGGDINWDEYDSEISAFLTKLKQYNISEDDILNLVYNIFVEYFGQQVAGGKEKYEKLANNIYTFFKERKWI